MGGVEWVNWNGGVEQSTVGGLAYSEWSTVGGVEWNTVGGVEWVDWSGGVQWRRVQWVEWSTVGGVGHLEAGDGVFSSLCEGLVDPTHDGVVGHFLPVSELLQDVQGVSEETHRLSK